MFSSLAFASPSAAPPERTRDLQARVDLNPLDSLAHNELGVAFAGSGDLTRAIRHLWMAVLADETLVDAWANLGLALRKSKAHSEALAAFSQALKLNEKQAELWYSAGASLRSLKQDPASMFALEAYLKHASKTHPKRAKIQRVVAKWREKGLKASPPSWPQPKAPERLVSEIRKAKAAALESARQQAQEAEAASTSNASATMVPQSVLTHPKVNAIPGHGGDKAFEAQHYLKALADYESEARIRPQDGVLLYKIGATRAILGDPTGALRAWRRVLQQTPGREILNRQIAFATRRMAEWGMLETTRKLDGDIVKQARSALISGDPADVLLLTETSSEREALFLRGEAALRLGKLDVARSAFEKGLTIAPDDRGLRGGQIEVLIHLGAENAEEAAQIWMDDMESTSAAFLAERALVVARRVRYGSLSSDFGDEFDDEIE